MPSHVSGRNSTLRSFPAHHFSFNHCPLTLRTGPNDLRWTTTTSSGQNANYSRSSSQGGRFLKMADSSIAKKVIKETLQVKEDEQVLIQTWGHTVDLSNAL